VSARRANASCRGLSTGRRSPQGCPNNITWLTSKMHVKGPAVKLFVLATCGILAALHAADDAGGVRSVGGIQGGG
jgi:hypothetical protein